MTRVAPSDIATAAGNPPPPKSWKAPCMLLLFASIPTSLFCFMAVLSYQTSNTPDVQLASAVVSTRNASSLAIDADWLLTFHVAITGGSYPNHYGPVEAAVLYATGGGSQLEIAGGQLPPFDVGPDSTFNLRLRPKPAARDDWGIDIIRVLNDTVAGTGSVEFRVLLKASCREDFAFGINKPRMFIRVDCDPVRVEFSGPGGGGGGLLSGSLAKSTSCCVEQIY
ncbi:unnamed protein product [Linum trigynum]|uniref:Late embryogenesis abundant protein LEA-2 subgroup domain-containing protein n=1 Tax=Linum trigynum TaxID=586398 RepID=A0AAV2CIF9_9ROSI